MSMNIKDSYLERDAFKTNSSTNIYEALITLLDRLDQRKLIRSEIIPWSCPVPVFGDLSTAHVATLGINPSNREFMDASGSELMGVARRFHTLRSLGLDSWQDIDARHLDLLISSFSEYFAINPYNLWFQKLNTVISGTMASYYDPERSACHLDLVPYATARKWTALPRSQKLDLLSASSDVLAVILRESPVRVIVLNGAAVVQSFQRAFQVSLESEEIPSWTLFRRNTKNVSGFAYKGRIHSIGGLPLQSEILALGFNHNIQSSFGISTNVISAITDWITKSYRDLSV